MEGHVYNLDLAAAGTLTEQLTENLRRAIANGIYKPGDRLPGIREMAKLCGTSVQVPIDAFKALADEGFVKARPRIGCIVLGKNRKVWQGRILIVHVGAYTNYSQNVFCAESARLLETANWRVEHAFVPRSGIDEYDITAFRKEITEKYDLVLLPAYDPPVVGLVRDSELPHMLLSAQAGDCKEPGCIGMVVQASSQAFADFAEHCRQNGIRRMLCVTADVCALKAFEVLKNAGVTVEELVIRNDGSDKTVERFARWAFEVLMQRLGDGRRPRPDMIFFSDDYLARGGFLALERLGIHAPEDIKVVSLVNTGNAPFYPKPLTRFEHDPFDEAKKMVQMILRYFKTGRPPRTVLCNMRYVRGETF